MNNELQAQFRRQLEELVRGRVRSLEQDISRMQRQVNEGFTRLLETADAAGTIGDPDALLDSLAALAGQSRPAARPPAEEIAALRDAIAELQQQRTQADVLNALVASAARFAPRVALFVIKGQNALGWNGSGFDESLGGGALRRVSVSLQSDTVLRAALDAQGTAFGQAGGQAENSLLFARLGAAAPAEVLAVPLKVRSKSAALLYADGGPDAQPINVEAIELLVQSAGLVIELASLRARAGDPAAHAPQEAAPRPSAPLPAPPPAPRAAEEQPAASASHYFRPAAEPAHVSQPRATEVVAAAPPAEAPAPSAPPPAAHAGVSEEEEKAHRDARRFARLLVSEIKLYNEQKVADGRRNNDLYERLKEDIDRSRQMYEKRITPSVASKFDYFYDELVTTLAEGDPARLGSGFPGPTVGV